LSSAPLLYEKSHLKGLQYEVTLKVTQNTCKKIAIARDILHSLTKCRTKEETQKRCFEEHLSFSHSSLSALRGKPSGVLAGGVPSWRPGSHA